MRNGLAPWISRRSAISSRSVAMTRFWTGILCDPDGVDRRRVETTVPSGGSGRPSGKGSIKLAHEFRQSLLRQMVDAGGADASAARREFPAKGIGTRGLDKRRPHAHRVAVSRVVCQHRMGEVRKAIGELIREAAANAAAPRLVGQDV